MRTQRGAEAYQTKQEDVDSHTWRQSQPDRSTPSTCLHLCYNHVPTCSLLRLSRMMTRMGPGSLAHLGERKDANLARSDNGTHRRMQRAASSTTSRST